MDVNEQIQEPARLVNLTADLVAAYVSNNHIQSADLANLISGVHGAISTIASGTASTPTAQDLTKTTPQAIRKSIGHDFLISFEDGKPYKTLRRHLTLRGLSPEAYRAKWGLPKDYPMTSASYSEQRSKLARSLGLGQQRRRTAAATAAEAPVSAPEAPSEKKARSPRRKKEA